MIALIFVLLVVTAVVVLAVKHNKNKKSHSEVVESVNHDFAPEKAPVEEPVLKVVKAEEKPKAKKAATKKPAAKSKKSTK